MGIKVFPKMKLVSLHKTMTPTEADEFIDCTEGTSGAPRKLLAGSYGAI